MKNAKLQAIFFDVDDTLYSTTEFARLARSNALDAMIKLNLKVPKDVLEKELDEVVAEFSSNYEHHFDKLLCRLPKRTYEGVNPAILVAAAVSAYHDTKFNQLKPYDDAVELLSKLKNTPLIVGVITSGLTIKQAEKILRLGLYQYLTPNAIFITDQLGVGKPNVKLYQHVLQELKLQPRKTMYVGDNPINDIDPPNELDMITVLNKRTDKYSSIKGKTQPKYEISNFKELEKILITDFEIKL